MTTPTWNFTTIHLRLSEIAEKISVSTATCSNWRRRHPDFPTPDEFGSYAADAVIDWLGKRPIPAAYRTPAERDGATYGDRLQRALGEGVPTRTCRDAGDGQANQAARQFLCTGLPRRFRDAGISDIDYLDAGLLLVFTWICSEQHWQRLTDEIQPHASADRPTVLLGVVAEAVDAALRLHGLPVGAAEVFGRLRKARTSDVIALIDSASRAGKPGFDRLLDQLPKAQPATSRDYRTPAEVARLMARCVTPPGNSVNTVLDPYTRLGELPLAVLGRKGATPVQLRAIGRRTDAARRAGLNLAVHGCVSDIQVEDKLPWQYRLRGPYDAVVVNPPFNETFLDSTGTTWPFATPPHSGNLAWVHTAVKVLAAKGRAAVLLPAAAGGTNNRYERENRKEMLEQGAVHAVIRLPAQIFPASSVDAAIWVLRPPSKTPRPVVFADVRSMLQATPGSLPRLADTAQIAELVNTPERLKEGIAAVVEHGGRAISVPIETIREAKHSLVPDDYLQSAPTDADARWQTIGRYTNAMARAIEAIDSSTSAPFHPPISRTLSSPRALDVSPVTDKWFRARLSDLCEIKAGPSNTYGIKYEPDSAFQVLKAKHIHSRRLEVPENDDSRISPEMANRLADFEVHENDILFVRVGQVGDAALVTDMHHRSYFATNVIRLRIKNHDALAPEYLLEWLLSDDIRLRIRSRAAVNSVPSISTGDLGRFEIEYPPTEQQRAIATVLQECDHRAQAYQDAATQCAAYRTAVAAGLLSGAAKVDRRSTFEQLYLFE